MSFCTVHGVLKTGVVLWFLSPAMTNLDSILKNRDITLPTKVYRVKLWSFQSHVWMWELDCKEGWAPKNWCFQIVVLEKTLESPLNSKEIKPVNAKGNQLWIFIGKTIVEATILRSNDAKSRLIGKDSDVRKDWKQKEKGTTEDEIVRWYHGFNGLEFKQTPGDSRGQRNLAGYSPWDLRELDRT